MTHATSWITMLDATAFFKNEERLGSLRLNSRTCKALMRYRDRLIDGPPINGPNQPRADVLNYCNRIFCNRDASTGIVLAKDKAPTPPVDVTIPSKSPTPVPVPYPYTAVSIARALRKRHIQRTQLDTTEGKQGAYVANDQMRFVLLLIVVGRAVMGLRKVH